MSRLCRLLAGVCFLLGCACRFVFTAVRFTGFLLWCAAGVLAVWALLGRWSGKRWTRWAKRGLLCLLAAGAVFFAVLEAQVIAWGRTDQETETEAAVILGTGVNGREPSLSLLVRLEAALEYLQARPAIPVVVSGSQGPGELISEAACMAAWLTAHGISEERIYLEEQADTTAENVKYSKEILKNAGIPEDAAVAVISSDYHLCRAARLWGEGMVPVAAHMPGRYFPLTANYYIREAFALAAEIVF